MGGILITFEEQFLNMAVVNQIVFPRWTDVFFVVIFPLGINIIWQMLLIFAGFWLFLGFSYLISEWLHRKNSPGEHIRSGRAVGIELLLFLITGTFIPVLMLVWVHASILKTCLNWTRIIQLVRRAGQGKTRGIRILHLYGVLSIAVSILIELLLWVGGFYIYFRELEVYRQLIFTANWIFLGGVILFWLLHKGSDMIAELTKPFKLPQNDKPFKKRSALIGAIILMPLLSGSIFLFSGILKLHSIPTNLRNPPEITNMSDLRIMTYNIRLGAASEINPANNWVNRMPFFCGYVDSYNADIICVQEAYLYQITDMITNLKNRTYKFMGFGRDDGVFGGEFSAILFDAAKFTFLDGDTFWLSDKPNIPTRTWGNGHYRVCTWARFAIKTSGVQFCVFSTHYDFSDVFQTKASQLINAKVVEYTGDLPVFVMGDFNMYNTSAGFAFMENYGSKPLQDAYRVYHGGVAPYDWSFAPQFNANFQPSPSQSRIDFIFISEGISVEKCWIPKDRYGSNQTYSDHYPVLLDCTI
jgi:endonuclease/exonuclease/phosphatase family metal-dependent hydrolase